MTTRSFQKGFLVAAFLVAALAISTVPALAQAGSEGSMVVTALDSSGAVIPDASLTLTVLSTNDVRTATTGHDGSHTFVNLAIGAYSLSISRQGYATKTYDRIIVQAAHVTDIAATLPVGKTTETVRVTAATIPVMDTSSNAIGSVIDVKQIEDLPLSGRDITAFSTLVPGYSRAGGTGTFNGLPAVDQGNNINGMASSTSRMKFSGNVQPAVSPRLEDIEQMTVQTDQLDLNSGFGQATTQLNFVSKRGTNRFHGRLFEDFRNSWLNANSWTNNAINQPRNKMIFNDFGGSISGPIFRDKLFFFGAFATRRVPGGYTATDNLFTQDAQSGNFTYQGSDGNQHTVNVLDTAHQQNSNLPGTVNSQIASQLALINSAVTSGSVAPTADPNLDIVGWNVNNPTTYYYPAVRVDYNASSKARFYLSWLMSKNSNPANNPPDFPGPKFANQAAGNLAKNYTASFGFNYIFSPTIINQFTAGFLYNMTKSSYNAAPLYVTQPTVLWGYPNNPYPGQMSGQVFQTPITTYYPILNFDDAVTVERKSHTIQFGVSWYHEQDHYWNPPLGYYNYDLGLASGDPALNALTSDQKGGGTLPYASSNDLGLAQQLYAILTGRISGVNGSGTYNAKTGKYAEPGQVNSYALDEVASAWGLFAEDSWKVTPTFTLNYGLRWDIYAPEKDLTGFYHSSDEAALYGPTAVGDLFHPGSLNGDMNPQISTHAEPYKPWRVTPQPSIGFAWNPRIASGSAFHTLLGDGDTVIRGGFALRRYTEPYQYFWDYATSFASFYYQNFNLNANNSGATGAFTPGSLSLGDTLPPFQLSPEAYQATAPQSEFTFLGGVPVTGLEPNLKQPYAESWNLGIQRMVGHNLALEVRYNGNRTLHQWLAVNPNEVNVFENGFLKDFQNAQLNLAASGGKSFSSKYGNPTPIIDAAFGGPNSSDYSNGQYIDYLNHGSVGALANTLAGIGNQDYFCNLVGTSFAPCANNIGYSGAGAGYPINFFQANPYAAGSTTGELVSAGYSNYNGLQVDLRQGHWHGLEYDANYTWSKSLGVGTGTDWTGAFNAFTLRDLGKSYGPTMNDVRNIFHGSGTYDLPFGKGHQFLNSNRFANETVGGWTVGTIVTWQTGAPYQLRGGYSTFNDYGDGGIVLNGVTPSQLQSSVGVHRVGRSYVDSIDPKYLKTPTGGGANQQFVAPNTTPGTIGRVVYLHGPRQFFQDISLSKSFPIHEDYHFRLQASFLNAWNHPVFGNPSYGDQSIQSSGFGHSGTVSNFNRIDARQIELRANFEF